MEKKNLTLKQEKNYTAFSTPATELLVKIHTATGWRMPKTEQMCISLASQLEKKLHFNYPSITHDQVETAFLQFGGEENFTGSMSIAQIDKVLRKYFASITDENFNNERKSFQQTIPIPLPEQHLQECRALIEHKYQLYLAGTLNIELLPPFIFPVIRKDFKKWFEIDSNLPMECIQEAKQVIAERKGNGRIRKSAAINAVLVKAEPMDVENTSIKLAIEYCFEKFKALEMEHLYEK